MLGVFIVPAFIGVTARYRRGVGPVRPSVVLERHLVSPLVPCPILCCLVTSTHVAAVREETGGGDEGNRNIAASPLATPKDLNALRTTHYGSGRASSKKQLLGTIQVLSGCDYFMGLLLTSSRFNLHS